MLSKCYRNFSNLHGKTLPEYLSCRYTKAYFEKKSMVLIEGKEQIKQVLEAGGQLKRIFHLADAELGSFQISKEIPYEKIGIDSMRHLSRLNRVHKIAGLFKRPTNEELESSNKACLNLSIIADELWNFVNLGTLIKNAALAGCKRIFLMRGCANLWNPLCVRASGAAYFQIPIYTKCQPDDINKYISPECKLYLADLPSNLQNKKSILYDRVDWSQESALVIGNEVNGITEHYHTKVEFGEAEYVYIPQAGELNSLSGASAATVISFEALRQASTKNL